MKKACKRIRTKEKESELWVSGQFVSEADMIELGVKEHRRKMIKEECSRTKGWVRPGGHTHT